MRIIRSAAVFVGISLGVLAAYAQGAPPALSSPAAEAPEAGEWFVAPDGQPQGPFTAEEVMQQGLDGSTLVWRDGMADWAVLSQVPELAPRPRDAPPTPERSGPPPIPQQDRTEYFVAEQGSPVGPLSRAEVAQRLAGGSVTEDTLVWHEGMGEWAPLGQTRLAALLERPAALGSPEPKRSLDPVEALSGRWRVEIQQNLEGAPMQLEVEVAYARDGRLSGTGIGRLDLRDRGIPDPIRLRVALEGTWSADAVGADRVRLHTKGTMRMAAPELGIEGETDTFDDTDILYVVDENTLRDDEGNLYRRLSR